jgi:pyruvate-ferredoxin/flavodoxin oxidoreductase
MTVSGDGAAYDIGFGALSKVLTSKTPVKMLVWDTGAYSNTGGQASSASFVGQNSDLARHGKSHFGKVERRKELALLAALHPDVFVAQVSTAMHAHFLAATARMIAYQEGSALLQVYTPCGFEQGFADDLSNARSKLAVRSRMAPLFVHDPTAGVTLTQRLSLDGNPELDKPWATQNLKYVDDEGATKVLTMPLTPADFAYGEIRFAKQFRALADDAGTPTPIADYVELSGPGRVGRTPYITTTDASGSLIKVAVGSPIVDLVEERQRNWQLLRFLAGRDSSIAAQDAAKAIKALTEELALAQTEREQGIDEIAQALARLATAQDSPALPSLGSDVAPVAGAASVPPVADLGAESSGAAPSASPVPTVAGLGAKPAGAPIWLADEDIVKCTDCGTCHQEMPAVFEPWTIVVDGEAKDVARMKPGALDSLEVTPGLEVIIERVKGTCDSEIIQ